MTSPERISRRAELAAEATRRGEYAEFTRAKMTLRGAALRRFMRAYYLALGLPGGLP